MNIKRETDLAWCAGFFDGEGTIGIVGSSVRIIVTQKDRQPLDKFKEIVGWGIVYPKHKSKTPTGKTTYYHRYYVGGAHGRLVLKSLYPYLFVKKPKVQLAIEAYTKRKVALHNNSTTKFKRGRPITKDKPF